MRIALALLLCAVFTGGCSHQTKRAPSAAAAVKGDAFVALDSAPGSALIVTPDLSLTGKVMLVNREARFVVLNFPIGRLPTTDQRLSVYRLGLKVGEITITGPQTDDNIVGNLTDGEAAVGDAVRDR